MLVEVTLLTGVCRLVRWTASSKGTFLELLLSCVDLTVLN